MPPRSPFDMIQIHTMIALVSSPSVRSSRTFFALIRTYIHKIIIAESESKVTATIQPTNGNYADETTIAGGDHTPRSSPMRRDHRQPVPSIWDGFRTCYRFQAAVVVVVFVGIEERGTGRGDGNR